MSDKDIEEWISKDTVAELKALVKEHDRLVANLDWDKMTSWEGHLASISPEKIKQLLVDEMFYRYKAIKAEREALRARCPPPEKKPDMTPKPVEMPPPASVGVTTRAAKQREAAKATKLPPSTDDRLITAPSLASPRVVLERMDIILSSDTDGNQSTDGSPLSRRKRPRGHPSHESDSAPSDEDLVVSPTASTSKGNVSKRGRGRPPATGQSVGLEKAKADLLALKRQELELEAEKEVEAMSQKARALRPLGRAQREEFGRALGEVANETADDLRENIIDDTGIIREVALKSANLKGTFVRSLKEAAARIEDRARVLAGCSVSSETEKLTAEVKDLKRENSRLRAEVANLHKEFAAFRAEAELERARAALQPPPPPPEKETVREQPLTQDDIMRTVRNIVDARLEGRLLPDRPRPSLQHERRSMDTTQPESAPVALETVVSGAAPAPAKPAKGKGVGKKSKGTKGPTPAAPQRPDPRPLPPAPASLDAAWSEVVKRKKKGKGKGKGVNPPPQTPARPDKPGRKAPKKPEQKKAAPKARWPAPKKLRPPRSAAIVIQLEPEAVERGRTYQEVFTEFRSKIKLRELGITEIKPRAAKTGARILEVSGEGHDEKADALAAAIRQAIPAGDVRVTRPIKRIELRVSGLDDSVTSGEVAAKVAEHGGCPEEAVTVGEIRHASSGTGTAWVRCPVAAGKKLALEGRLLVGWVAARVTLLPPRPLRCYRCLQVGHVGKLCPAEVDRSRHCYRCGVPGHIAAQCTGELRCLLCAEAGKPARHRLGAWFCTAPKKPPRRAPTKPAATGSVRLVFSASQPALPRAGMDVS